MSPTVEARRALLAGEPLPFQPTSWDAVYHVLQRYGAWTALNADSEVFHAEGRFRRRATGQ